MAGRHRTRKARRLSVALVSAATATATALTVGVEPPPDPAKRLTAENVDLAAAIQLLPDSGQYPNPKAIPDLTGGLGTTVYDFSQTILDQLIRAVVNGVSLTAFAQAAGVDPQSLVDTLLTEIPANLLPSILASISLDLPVLDTVLGQLGVGDQGLLTNVLNLLGVDEITDGTLTGLLALLGLDLSDPLNLANLNVPGVNLITAGPTFTVLKMLGLDLGWVPGLPNSVANEINGTPYLELGVNGVVEIVQGLLNDALDNGTLDLGLLDDLLGGLGLPLPGLGTTLEQAVASLVASVAGIITPVTGALPDVLHARVTPTVGIGIGAFAAAMAYQQVIDDLENQPGGSAYPGVDPILGSLTLLPLILINNPGRPDGGAFARFGPLAALFGIDTVNPHTQLTGDGGLPVGNTGLHLGGANVLPILVDATYEFQPLSDLASWPNPVTLLNNLAAGLFPTYMLRGLSLDGLTDQITPQLTAALADVAAGNPLALNLYLTLHSATLPTLEPLYLASDLLNIVGLSPLAQIPMRLANALAPAATILTYMGYANVVQNPDGTYTRDFSTAGEETPFLSFADIDYGKALGDTITALFGGFQKEFLSGNPTPNTPNALASLLGLLGGGLPGLTTATGTGTGTGTGTPTDPLSGLLNGIGGLLGGLLGGLGGATPLAATSASSVPSSSARMLSLAPEVETTSDDETAALTAESTPSTEESDATEPAAAKDAADKTPAEKTAAEQVTVDEEAADKEAADKEAAPVESEPTAPKHAKPDTEADATDADAAKDADATTAKKPKHAKPELNIVRDTANDFSPKDETKGEASETGKKDAEPTTTTADASAASGAEGGASSENAA